MEASAREPAWSRFKSCISDQVASSLQCRKLIIGFHTSSMPRRRFAARALRRGPARKLMVGRRLGLRDTASNLTIKRPWRLSMAYPHLRFGQPVANAHAGTALAPVPDSDFDRSDLRRPRNWCAFCQWFVTSTSARHVPASSVTCPVSLVGVLARSGLRLQRHGCLGNWPDDIR